MENIATVRAEIKHWERTFKEDNGRHPTVDDIKLNPTIAEKYKLYKRLNKAAASSSSSHSHNNASIPSPSTPPRKTRPKDPPSILLSRTRQVEPTAPLASFNPFSPQKQQKGKERATYKQPVSGASRPNLFQKGTSPEPFSRLSSDVVLPAASQTQPSSSSASDISSKNITDPPSAVIRARKRLRGEPVSPSPSKEKRRRVSSQTVIPFPRMQLKATDNDDDEEDEDMAVDADAFFVDESPMKQTSGKSFSTLFEDKIAPLDLFGTKSNLGLGDTSIKSRSNPSLHARPQRITAHGSVVSTLAKARDKAEEMEGLENLKLSTASSAKSDTGSQTTSRSSTKRPISPDETEAPPVPRARSPLIPPSPPPSTTSFNQPVRRGKPGKVRKRTKVVDDPASNESDEDGITSLKIVKRNPPRPRHAADEDEAELNSDPILSFSRTAMPHASPPVNFQQDEGHVEIDLPEKLRHVLALHPAASHNSEEERLVKGLLYGRKTTWYDPNKGGEIWDIGEDHNVTSVDETSKYTDGEDDWEGEPVPWEVGEM